MEVKRHFNVKKEVATISIHEAGGAYYVKILKSGFTYIIGFADLQPCVVLYEHANEELLEDLEPKFTCHEGLLSFVHYLN